MKFRESDTDSHPAWETAGYWAKWIGLSGMVLGGICGMIYNGLEASIQGFTGSSGGAMAGLVGGAIRWGITGVILGGMFGFAQGTMSESASHYRFRKKTKTQEPAREPEKVVQLFPGAAEAKAGSAETAEQAAPKRKAKG
jgi:hypothetical protein